MVGLLFDISNAIWLALLRVSDSFVSALPAVFAAIVLIAVGYLIGWVVKKFVVKLFESTKVDDWVRENNLSHAIGDKRISEIGGSIVKWYVFFVFIKQAVSLISLSVISEVLGLWINLGLLVIAAAVVILGGLIIARYIRNAIEATKHHFSKIVGLIVEVTIVYIALVMGVKMIGLPTEMLEFAFMIAFAGFVFCVALIFGISFGFAMRSEAKIIIKGLKKKN